MKRCGDDFLIIITAYNVSRWLDKCLSSIRSQTHHNFLCIVSDDGSTDTTSYIAQEFSKYDHRFKLVNTREPRSGQGEAYLTAIRESLLTHNPERIIVEVDGDDWLANDNVLGQVHQIYYQDSNIWMTYGQYKIYPTYETGGHFHVSIPDHVDQYNLYRSSPFPYSHLKTYKTWLFDKIKPIDLVDPNTGKAFNAAWDHVLCMPMVEMAGKQHIYRIPDITYILNRHDELQNEGRARGGRQKEVSEFIRTKSPYNKIQI